MFIIYLNMRKSCSVLWTFSHVINIILRGMIKGWWYRYQSRQTNTVVMFFQYYICKFPLFSTKYMYMINKFKYHQFLYLCSVLYLHLITFTMSIPLLLVHESIIHPVVSAASALTWFIRHIYYWNLQFLNNVYIIIFPGIAHFGNPIYAFWFSFCQ